MHKKKGKMSRKKETPCYRVTNKYYMHKKYFSFFYIRFLQQEIHSTEVTSRRTSTKN